jgi:hypothetical protein
VDAEQYATIHNLGFEAAMAQQVAPEGRESDATDWLEDKLDQAAADALRDAATAADAATPDENDFYKLDQAEVGNWLRARADMVYPTEKEPNG